MTSDANTTNGDPESPKLTLGDPPRRLASIVGGIPRGWLWSVFGLQLLLVVLLLDSRLRPSDPAQSTSPTADSAAELKAAAMALEERSLYAEAARTWATYLRAHPADPDRPQILFRAGKLAVQAENFSQAVTLLIQAEQAAGSDAELKSKTGPLVVECLRRLGHYGEVGRELSRRVEPGADRSKTRQVLATIAGEEFTQADLDRLIERRVDQMLSVSGGQADAARRNAMLKQLSGPEMRRRMLDEFLQTELFSRRARELKLDRDEDYAEARRLLVENLLSSRFLARELDKIQPTDVDVEAYYRSQQKRYEQPGSMSLVLIEADGPQQANSLLSKVSSADTFRAQAVASLPAVKSEVELPRHKIERGRRDPRLGDTDPLFELAQGEWTQEAHAGPDGKLFLVLCEARTAARTAPLAEIRNQVEADYRTRKRQELSQKLFRDLMVRYKVKIEPPAAAGSEQAKPSATDSTSATDSQKQDDGS